MYDHRLASIDDAKAIASLWQEFLLERSQQDTSMVLKPKFDYLTYVQKKLESPSVYTFVLEHGETKHIVGFLSTYVRDENPSLDDEGIIESPFQPRRIGSAIGMYIQKPHRQQTGVLIKAAITLAEELKVSDLDLLISIEQKAVHKLLERSGFTKGAIQYTRHYEITEKDLPPLKRSVSQGIKVKMPTPSLIPLQDYKTQQPVINPRGEQVFLHPVKNNKGDIIRTSNGLPVYPTPLRNPQTQDWVFDESGELVVCPVVFNESGNVKENQNSMAVFKKPVVENIDGQLTLKTDETGHYLFSE